MGHKWIREKIPNVSSFHLFLALIGVFCLTIGSWAFASFVIIAAAVVVRVDRALTNEETAKLLYEQYHLIASPAGYRIYTALARMSGAKQGSYELHPGLRYSDIAHLLARGQERAEREVRVIEGWDIRNQADQLTKLNPVWSTGFLALVNRGEAP
jgi:cell division protein YceG involved in septum cleavage